MNQMTIFEFLDETLTILQSQVDFKIIKHEKNWSWDSQNREEWFLYYDDRKGKEKIKNVFTMKDLTIVRGLDSITITNGFFQGKPSKLIYRKNILIAYEPSPNFYSPAL